MGSRILYWLVIKPISLLPHFLLYGLSDFFFVVLYYLVGYRKKVVTANLRGCFPEKSEAEISEIRKKFYRHFCDLVLESLKNFSISEKEANKRMLEVNPEIMYADFEAGKSVIVASGHYGNWELWAAGAPKHYRHTILGVYKRLSNAFFEAKMRETRGKNGLVLVPTREYGDYLRTHPEGRFASALAFDQSPSNPKKCVWITFMGRETAALFGAEKYSKLYDSPIYYGHITKIKRGYYQIHYELIEANPKATAHGELTQRLHDVLEKDIRKAPEFWLWSHKRWKHKRPEQENFQPGVPIDEIRS